MTDLGRTMYTQGITLDGRLDAEGWKSFLRRAVECMGMNCAGEPAVWAYPVDGKGGNGMTICQPLTDSFLVVDTWPDHDGAYLHIASCKAFSVHLMREAMDEFSLGLIGAHHRTVMTLPLTREMVS